MSDLKDTDPKTGTNLSLNIYLITLRILYFLRYQNRTTISLGYFVRLGTHRYGNESRDNKI